MSIARYLTLALSTWPGAALSAQVSAPSTPPIRLPDLTALAPALARAQAGLVQAQMALGTAAARTQADLGRTQAELGIATTRVQARMVRAQAALAASAARVGVWSERGRYAIAGDEERTPPEAWAQQDPADRVYRDARLALNRGRFSSAASLFEQIYTRYPKSTYADDAYYWQAYALSKRDTDESLKRAIEVLRLQKAKAPNASTRRDADDLATRIEGRLAMSGDARAAERIATTASAAAGPAIAAPAVPGAPAAPAVATAPRHHGREEACDNEDDMQMAALNALLQMDADRATPILRKVLARRDPESLCLRRKAVFLVSQHQGPETERILLDAARTDPDQEVRGQAIFWLSQVDSPGVVPALDSILRGTTEPELQDKAIFALSQRNSPQARQALRDFALRPGISEDLRGKAIFWIGQGNDPDRLDFLTSIYPKVQSDDAKEKILFSVSQIGGSGSQHWLIQVAGDAHEDIELRKKALFWAGQSGVPSTELFDLYDKMPNKEMKEHMVFVISQRSEKAAVDKLFEIARTEPDRELRKKAIFWLSQSNDPRVAEFLARLLEKP